MSINSRMHYAKILLRELGVGPLSWSDLEKRMIALCGTHSKFVYLMNWLIDREYIIKEGPPKTRAPYRINPDKVHFNSEGRVIMSFS